MLPVLHSCSRVFLAVIATSFLLINLSAAYSFAQTTNTRVNGTVKDATGAVVAGASVTLLDAVTKREADDDGKRRGLFCLPRCAGRLLCGYGRESGV